MLWQVLKGKPGGFLYICHLLDQLGCKCLELQSIEWIKLKNGKLGMLEVKDSTILKYVGRCGTKRGQRGTA